MTRPRHCLHFAEIPAATHLVYDDEGVIETCAECAAIAEAKGRRVETIDDPFGRVAEHFRDRKRPLMTFEGDGPRITDDLLSDPHRFTPYKHQFLSARLGPWPRGIGLHESHQ